MKVFILIHTAYNNSNTIVGVYDGKDKAAKASWDHLEILKKEKEDKKLTFNYKNHEYTIEEHGVQ